MREYLAVFLVAFAITYLLPASALGVAPPFGAVARAPARAAPEFPFPYSGGAAL